MLASYTYSRTSSDELSTTLSRLGSGRNLEGMLAQVLRPITTAFRRLRSCTPSVTRLNHAMSPGSLQGSFPPMPIPPVEVTAKIAQNVLLAMVEIGVVALSRKCV